MVMLLNKAFPGTAHLISSEALDDRQGSAFSPQFIEDTVAQNG